MIINPNWRILTVGDGDLSFSHALNDHFNLSKLVASTYDSATTIQQKYPDNALQSLQQSHVRVLNQFDVTQPKCWQKLQHDLHQFDVVIFQFPLLPAFSGKNAYEQHKQPGSMNILNRALLHQFIKYACEYALDPTGQQLCYITSKDVKPYREWNIEGSLTEHLPAQYLGQVPFDITAFDGYKIRNVDRNKHVKDTRGITYVFSEKPNSPIASQLTVPSYLGPQHCALCRVGPFVASEDETKHLTAKKHHQMNKLEQQWQQWLSAYYS